MKGVWAALNDAERGALLRLLAVSALQGVAMSGVVVVSNLILQGDSTVARVAGGLVNLVMVLGLGLLNLRIFPHYTGVVNDLLAERRVRMAERLRATDLRTHQIHPEAADAIAVEFDALNELPEMLVISGLMSASILCSTLFIGVLSTAGLIIWLAIVAAIVFHQRRTRAEMAKVGPVLAKARKRFGAALQLRLHGHAQLQHDAVGRTEDLERLLGLEGGTAAAQARLNHTRGQALAWGEDVLLVGLGVVVFRLPELAGLSSGTQYQLTTTLLSISGMTLVLVGLALQGRLLVGAAERLLEMERWLAAPQGPPPTRPPLAMGPELVLEVEKLTYAYEAGFTMGPVNLRVQGGELVIIRGGNGSGKTTLMRTLAGLYPASSGIVKLNGRRISTADLPWYQSHITAIFVDQHLFDALYGLNADPEEVATLLARFGLQEVVELRDGHFSRTALSSGQRKRLAMVVALLEHRPIIILDEWDSHQDPGLRAFYYDTLLPELQARGMIVLAVSHDQRRFHLADRLLHLEGGQVVVEE